MSPLIESIQLEEGDTIKWGNIKVVIGEESTMAPDKSTVSKQENKTMAPITEQLREAYVKSIDHHEDGVNRTEDNYKEFDMTPRVCALCQLHKFGTDGSTCKSCVLHSSSSLSPCCLEYYRANEARWNNDFPAFHKAEVALVARLKGELDKLNRKGEEIEVYCSTTVARDLNLPMDERAIWRFTGEFKRPYNEYHLYRPDRVYAGADSIPYPILEFVRMVKDEPKNRKGEEIELEYSVIVAGKLDLPRRMEKRAIWRFMGEYRLPEDEYFLNESANMVWAGNSHGEPHPILEFVRLVDEPPKPETITIPIAGSVKDGKVTWYNEPPKHEYEAKEVGKLKYKVGGVMHWDGTDGCGNQLDNPQECVIQSDKCVHDWEIRVNNGNRWHVDESSLSPLGYQVGDEFVCHMNMCCDDDVSQSFIGYKCRINRIDTERHEYELFFNTIKKPFGDGKPHRIDGSDTDDKGLKCKYEIGYEAPIVRCIDPKFWTVEKDGVAYRAYEDTGEDIAVYYRGEEEDWTFLFPHNLITKTLGIPVMPSGYMDGDFVYPVREDIK